ncbi:MAG: hypothetical protein R6U66_05340 [Bacteroidales bacterium]
METTSHSIKAQLNADLSLHNTQLVVGFIGHDEEKFAALMQLVTPEEGRIAGRAAWVMEKVAAQHPALLIPYLNKLIQILPAAQNDALKRHILKQLTLYPLVEEELGFLYEYSMEVLLSKRERVAAKIYAMQLMYQISTIEPDLKPELMVLIESRYNTGSPGYKNRASKLLKKLSKEIGS